MRLLIRAVSLAGQPLTQAITGVFDTRPGTIGRSETCTLMLPDPERHISRVQAEVNPDGQGGFAIRNVSHANPIIHNGRPIPAGRSAPLAEGDDLQIGAYLLSISVVSRPVTAPAAPHPGSVSSGFGHNHHNHHNSLGSGLSLLDSGPAAAVPHPPASSLLDNLGPQTGGWNEGAINQFLGPGKGSSPQAPSALSPLHPLDDLDRWGTAPAGLNPAPAPLRADKTPEIHGSMPLPSGSGFPPAPATSGSGVTQLLQQLSADRPAATPRTLPPATSAVPVTLPGSSPSDNPPPAPAIAMPPAPSVVPVTTPSPAAPGFAGTVTPTVPTPITQAPAAPAPAPTPPVAVASASASAPGPAPTTASDATVTPDVLWAAFCEGAGISMQPPGGLTPALMRTLGQMLLHSTEGTLKLVAARASTKAEMHAQVTMIQPRNNNPLKFSPDARVALEQLLHPPLRGFLSGPQAFEQAMDDLVGHTVGTLAGMRAALDGVLERFAPDQLEAKLTRQSVIDSFLPMHRRAKLWELYLQHFQSVREDAREDFHSLFGKAFLQAYERQIDRLEAERQAAAGNAGHP